MGKIYTKANVQNNNPTTPVSAGTMAIFDNGIDAVDTKTQNLPSDGSFDPAAVALKSYVDQQIDNLPDPYVLPKATTTTLGGVKVDGITIIIDSSGRISAVGGGGGGASIASVVYIDDAGEYYTSDNVEGALQEIGAILANKVDKVEGKGLSAEDFTAELKAKLEGIEAEANKYVLPVATPSVIGGVKPDGVTTFVDENGVLSSLGGGGASEASELSIDDAGGYYTSSDVEGALQEAGAKDSNLQTQINGKQATITGAASSIVTTNLTPARIAYFDDNGKIAATGAVTTTHLSYLIGVTSNIQTQLDGKSPKANPTFTGLIDAQGGQFKFPAIQNPSSDANTLDDYEEGTFTPYVFGDTTAGVGTYATQIGKYTKVGNLVSITLTVNWTNHTGSGTAMIGGLPFINSAYEIQAAYSGNGTGHNSAGAKYAVIQISTSQVYMGIYSTTTGYWISGRVLNTSGVASISATYLVA